MHGLKKIMKQYTHSNDKDNKVALLVGSALVVGIVASELLIALF